MFGILYSVFGLLSSSINDLKNTVNKNIKRDELSKQDYKLYYDYKGKMFWDGEQVFYKNINGHRVLVKKDYKTVVWDYTEVEEKEYNNLINDHNKKRYEDAIKNNKCHYIITINNHAYNIEIKTNKMIRLSIHNNRYYKEYYKLNNGIKVYDGNLIEIPKEEYYNLGTERSN